MAANRRQFLDRRYEELERQLNKNIDYHALLDQDEAIIFLKTLESDFKSLRDEVYSIADPLSNFAGNIKDVPGVFKIGQLN
ncbi:hypothetical protein [Xenorhabdus miraniensis]|uniref:Uncharacterized protein n=1 Tax=Xenorhabdus miraniensis TaxID=351674 RepID=A0A2D0JW55_9GAMM|nr:hypothetical protein [Xenorhabdus miraniensis]PHM50450.1 hypothetical protein Xmir_00632 [Xenorhabdus miraniensis]